MKRWSGPAFVVLLAATLPLLAPPAWQRSGALPDLAVLAVVHVAFRGTADRAAWTGIVVGAVTSLWTPEPAAFRPFVLGAAGWLAAQVASVLHRDSALATSAVAAIAVVAARVAEMVAAAVACRGGTPWTGADAAGACSMLALAAAAAALAAPLASSLIARFGLLAPLERTFRDV